MKNLKQWVRRTLETNVVSRDNDSELFWIYYLLRVSGVGVHAALENIPFESIRRLRQMVQREHPELRGTKYAKRHEKAKLVRSTIKHQEMPEDKKSWWKFWAK